MRILTLALLITMSHCLASQAVTFNLSPEDSIQETINSAADEDIINLAEGTYNESLDLSGKNISIIGQGESTIVDGSGNSGPVISCTSGSSAIDSILIRGGAAASGGGISITGSCALEVDRSTITDKSGTAKGSAIYINSGEASRFSYNLVTFNVNGGSGEPHSIYIENSSPTFNRNTIANNSSPGNAFFIIGSESAPRLSRNIISRNGDSISGVGRGLCIVGGASARRVRLTRNIFYRNAQAEIFINGRDFRGRSGLNRAQRQNRRSFRANSFTNPRFVVNNPESFEERNFGLRRNSRTRGAGASSGRVSRRHPNITNETR